jgi:hypothetical protein
VSKLVSLTKFAAQVGRLRRQIPKASSVSSVKGGHEAACHGRHDRRGDVRGWISQEHRGHSAANELRFEARRKLGQMLAKVDRAKGARSDLVRSPDEVGYRAFLQQKGLDKNRANECFGALSAR